jgi:hypothetical protein
MNIEKYINKYEHFNIIKIWDRPVINVDILEDPDSSAVLKYGLIYHAMAYCKEISLLYGTIKLESLKYFTKYDKISYNKFEKLNNSINIDFEYKKLIRDQAIEEKNKDANMTYLYCHDLIKVNILKCILDINKINNVQIIFPTISSTVIIELIYIFSYICDSIYLYKNGDWLKDSFILCGKNINREKLKYIVSDINNNIKFSTQRTKCLNGITIINNEDFTNTITNFSLHIQIICSYLWNMFFKNYNKNTKNRDNDVWKEYDSILNLNK